MKANDLKVLEKLAIRSFYQDGLWDIFLGVVMLQFVFGPYLNNADFGHFWSLAVFFPVYVFAWLLIRHLKRKIILPRVSIKQVRDEHSKQRSPWVRWFHFMILAGLFAGILVVWFWEKQPEQWLFSAFLSGIFLVGFYVGAALLDFHRLYYYGLLTGIAIIGGEILQQKFHLCYHGFPCMFGIVSVIMIVTGFFLLIRFLKQFHNE